MMDHETHFWNLIHGIITHVKKKKKKLYDHQV